MKRGEYRAYLKSPEWAALRRSVLVRDGNRCRICNDSDRLEVHHRTYDRVGDEDPNDLTTLCHRCHDRHHVPELSDHVLELSGRVRTVPKIPRQGPERAILCAMLNDPAAATYVGERLSPDSFVDPVNRDTFRALIQGSDEPDPTGIFGAGEHDYPTTQRSLEESVTRLMVANIDRRLEVLDGRLHEAADEDERLRVLKEKHQLTEERKQFGSDWRKSARAALRKEQRRTSEEAA